MKEDIKKLQREYDAACEANERRFQSCPVGLSFQEFREWMRPTSEICAKLSRELRFVKEPEFRELSDIGDVMSIEHFKACVEAGGFIDSDGDGNYIRGDLESDIHIFPSDVKAGMVRSDFDEIVWYNK